MFLLGGGVASDTAAMRIVELSKKVREQTAELEAEKTRNKQFTKKCRDLENQVFYSHKEFIVLKGSTVYSRVRCQVKTLSK